MQNQKNRDIEKYIEQTNVVPKIDMETLDEIILTENMVDMYDLEAALSVAYHSCKSAADKKKLRDKHNQVATHCNKIAGKPIFILL